MFIVSIVFKLYEFQILLKTAEKSAWFFMKSFKYDNRHSNVSVSLLPANKDWIQKVVSFQLNFFRFMTFLFSVNYQKCSLSLRFIKC